MKLYNTLSKTKEEFTPIAQDTVTMYSCGPTVYNYPHIGNFKAFMTADILHRYLIYRGYNVRMVMNITDVGHLTDDDVAQGDAGTDKMQLAAEREKKSPYDIARYYEQAFFTASNKLHILPPTVSPRATEHIAQIIALIERLIASGHAYEANGNVFYDVTTFPKYGALSGNNLEKLKVGARIQESHPDKKHQWDFALWLTADKSHLMRWQSPWSTGYPGWHIECSAMSMHYLGEHIDIHTGGEDHIFPHHEAEIAQSEGATNKKFANYWLHTRHMLIDGKKMSKSKGNFYTLDDIEEKGFCAEDLRMSYFLSHYRSQMNFTWDVLAQASKNRTKIVACAQRLRNYSTENNLDTEKSLDTAQFCTKFDESMDDDLNTPEAVSVVLSLASHANALMDEQRLNNPEAVYLALEKFNAIFALTLDAPETAIPHEVMQLAQERDTARKEKDFAHADELRDQIAQKGYTVKDTADGFTVVPLS